MDANEKLDEILKGLEEKTVQEIEKYKNELKKENLNEEEKTFYEIYLLKYDNSFRLTYNKLKQIIERLNEKYITICKQKPFRAYYFHDLIWKLEIIKNYALKNNYNFPGLNSFLEKVKKDIQEYKKNYSPNPVKPLSNSSDFELLAKRIDARIAELETEEEK